MKSIMVFCSSVKYLSIAIFLIGLMVTAVYAESAPTPTEDDYKNLDELRGKLVRMKREMDKFIGDIMETYPAQGGVTAPDFGQDVRVDVMENDKNVLVKADLPGMDKDRIEITLANNRVLKIGGSRDVLKQTTAPGMVKRERLAGKFERVLELPAECMNEGIKASYNNGVLDIVIPKKKVSGQDAVKIAVQ